MSLKKSVVYKDLFNKFDLDGNGTIEFNEFLIHIKTVFSLEPTDKRFDRTFMSIFYLSDTSSLVKKKDNVIDKKEFKKIADAIPVIDDKPIEEIIGCFLFNIIDDNFSGKINLKEMEMFTESIGLGKEHASGFITQIPKTDSDESKISKKDFVNWYVTGFRIASKSK